MVLDKLIRIGKEDEKSIYVCSNCESRSFKLVKYEDVNTIYLECANCEHLHLNFTVKDKDIPWAS